MPLRILVLDDDPIALKLITHHVGGAGYDVVHAKSASEADDLVREHLPDVVIADWVMPDRNGLDFCRDLRRCGPDGCLYFVLLDAQSGPGRAEEAFAAGVDDYLAKPFEKQDLIARLHLAERIVVLERALAEALNSIGEAVRTAREGAEPGPPDRDGLPSFPGRPARQVDDERAA